MERSSAYDIAKLTADGKSVHAIRQLHPEVHERYIRLAFAAPLLMK
ncbi:hypothetical protein CCP4SC76_5290001 [Gammaproteobacteria bacterium]